MLYEKGEGGALSTVYSPKGLAGDIVIPEGVQSINVADFCRNSGTSRNITSLSIPSTCVSIGDYPVWLSQYNKSLTSLTVAEGNEVYAVSDGVFYTDGGKTAAFALPYASGEVALLDGATAVAKDAFNMASNITSVVMPESMRTIGQQAFDRCTKLESVKLNEGLEALGINAFGHCTSLARIDLPASLATVDYLPFVGCTALTTIAIADGGHFKFSEGVLYDEDDKVVFEVKYPNGRQTIMFDSDVETATIPADKFLHTFSFMRCASTVKEFVSENEEYVVGEDGILYSADKTELIKAPCTLAGDFKVPATVTKIWGYAFAGCKDLENVDMSESPVESIGVLAFRGTAMTTVKFPATLWMEHVEGNFATDPAQTNEALFGLGLHRNMPAADDTESTSVNHEVVELDLSAYKQSFIPNYLFASLYGLREIEIPQSVNLLGVGTFYACPNLKDVYVWNQNLEVTTSGATGDSGLGWTADTPSTFSWNDEEGYHIYTGMNFYGMNYDTNTVKEYADKYDCTFIPFVFLGNYEDANAMAEKVEGGAEALEGLAADNTIQIADIDYTGKDVTPALVVSYDAKSDPAVAERTLVPGKDCTVTFKNAKGEAVDTVVEAGAYTAEIVGDGKSVFGTMSVTFNVVDQAAKDAEAASAATALLDKLPADAAQANAADVAAARKAYDALTADQKKLVPAAALDKLTAAEKHMADTQAAADAKAKAEAAAKASNINTATVSAAQVKKASDLGVTTVTLGAKVKKIAPNAFKGTRIKTLVVKTTKLNKKKIKGSLKGSAVTTVKVQVKATKSTKGLKGKKLKAAKKYNKKAKATNKKYVKKYKKIFTKKIAGKKVKVK